MASGNPASAAREALRRRRDAIRAGRSHLVEATLARSGILRHMSVARLSGYRIVLHHVSVATPEQALGGHDVPEADARRRFARSQVNLSAAIACADEAVLYDNTDPDRPHREVAILTDGIRGSPRPFPAGRRRLLPGSDCRTRDDDKIHSNRVRRNKGPECDIGVDSGNEMTVRRANWREAPPISCTRRRCSPILER